MGSELLFSWPVWTAIGITIFAAALTQGTFGFGFPAISTPVLVLLTDVKTAIVINLLPNLVVNIMDVIRGGNWGASLGRYWRVALYVMIGALAASAAAVEATASDTPEIAKAKYLWSQSPHGRMLERILPPAIEPGELPEPRSEGARLTARYCVQCHYLPSPRMHTAAQWVPIVERMVWRMEGRGNLGELMKEMMADIQAPSQREIAALTRYLQKHGQQEIDPKHPALGSTAGQMFSHACSQCHALPDPRRYSAREWPEVVERMKRHMAWANVVVGVSELRTVPELKTEEILRLLQRYARAEPKVKSAADERR